MRQLMRMGLATFVFLALTALAVDAPLFLTTPALTLGPGAPTVVLTPDLNEDGLDDVIVTNYDTARLTPLLNQGDGTLLKLEQFETAGQPVGAVAARIDGDEHIDVIIAQLESDSAWFLHGRGDGTFDAPSGPIAVGHDPLVPTGGDFNGDGKFDLALASSAEGAAFLSVQLGNGDGTFQAATLEQSLKDFGVAITVGDFNEDDHLDLVGSYSQTSIALFLGNGDGTFAALKELPTSSRTIVMLPKDIDGDGHLDLFLVQTGADTVVVLRGHGDGTFAEALTYPAGPGPAYAALVDITGDGALDAVLQGSLSRDIRVLPGDGHGGFLAPRAFAGIGEAQAIGALQLDGDGIPDIVAATLSNSEPGLAIFYGRADATLAGAENFYGDTATGAAVADVNDDGLPDLVFATPSTQKVGVLTALAGGGFAPARLTDSLGLPAGKVATGDFNADGKLDAVAASAVSRIAVLLMGNGDGTFSIGPSLSLDSGGALAAVQGLDVDTDGNLDVVLTQSGGTVAVLTGNGDGTFDPARLTTGTGGNGAPAFGDLNTDGHLDFAVLNNQLGRLALFLGDGSGAFTPGPTVTAGRQATVVLATDFNQDGIDDLAFADSLNRQVRVLYNDGTGAFPSSDLVRTDELPMSFVARDVAGDRRPDLLVATQSDGLVTAFVHNDTFTASPPGGVGFRPNTVLSGDFNGDGRYDAATLNSVGSLATVLTTIGGSLTPRGDANGDGSVGAGDVVALAYELSEAFEERVDQTGRGFASTAGADANGDGLVTRQDAKALLRRLF